MIKRPLTDTCNQDQKHFLIAELGKMSKSRYDWPKRDLPRALEAARKRAHRADARIASYEKVSEHLRDRAHDKWQRKLAAVRKVIYFGTPKAALTAVERLQLDYYKISAHGGLTR